MGSGCAHHDASKRCARHLVGCRTAAALARVLLLLFPHECFNSARKSRPYEYNLSGRLTRLLVDPAHPQGQEL